MAQSFHLHERFDGNGLARDCTDLLLHDSFFKLADEYARAAAPGKLPMRSADSDDRGAS
jgi:hypothetical protein